jgi:Zn-finger nucleic acid-binding protein
VHTPSFSCPRCNEPLKAVDLGPVSVRSCDKCHGTLLAHFALPQVLEATSVVLLKTFDLDVRLQALTDLGPGVPCVRCGRIMDHDNYCGANLVFFDRCEDCGLLWLDADELGTMTLMWARMERRHDRDHDRGEKILSEVSTFVDRVLIARAISNMMR